MWLDLRQGLGIFIAAVAIVASLAIPRSGAEKPMIRLIPMAAGFLQLTQFAPAVDFAASGWIMYGLLSIVCLVLAWRKALPVQGPIIALGLLLLLVAASFARGDDLASIAAVGTAFPFGGTGHWLALMAEGPK